jgi:hypothetical protein
MKAKEIWKGYAYLGGKYWKLEGLGILGRKVLESVRGKGGFRMWLCAHNRIWLKAL